MKHRTLSRMAAPVKKRAVNSVDNNPIDKRSDSDSSDEDSEAELMSGQQEQIQVDFEGRNPIDSDFHGIKQLLQQLFLKAHVDLSQLTDLIIRQNYVGSVVKQSSLDYESHDDDDDDDDDDDNAGNDVFGVTSVINLTAKQHLECVQQLRTLLTELCDEHGTDQVVTFVRKLLGDESRPVGLLINERFLNIPAQISLPLLENLNKEIKRACDKKMPFQFSYYIIICKFYRPNPNKKEKENMKFQDADYAWSNPEEEFIQKEAECSFEFPVKEQSDYGLGGQWTESDMQLVPGRRVLLIPANRFEAVVDDVRACLQ